MSPTQRIAIIKNWTPRAASILVALFLLVVFWGITNFVMIFLGVDSYFSVETTSNPSKENDSVSKDQEMDNFLKDRAQKRLEASVVPFVNEGQKDPFNLP